VDSTERPEKKNPKVFLFFFRQISDDSAAQAGADPAQRIVGVLEPRAQRLLAFAAQCMTPPQAPVIFNTESRPDHPTCVYGKAEVMFRNRTDSTSTNSTVEPGPRDPVIWAVIMNDSRRATACGDLRIQRSADRRRAVSALFIRGTTGGFCEACCAQCRASGGCRRGDPRFQSELPRNPQTLRNPV